MQGIRVLIACCLLITKKQVSGISDEFFGSFESLEHFSDFDIFFYCILHILNHIGVVYELKYPVVSCG